MENQTKVSSLEQLDNNITVIKNKIEEMKQILEALPKAEQELRYFQGAKDMMIAIENEKMKIAKQVANEIEEKKSQPLHEVLENIEKEEITSLEES